VRRLYLQIYLTVLAVLALFAVAWMWAWSAALQPHETRMLDGIARIAAELVPPAGAPQAEVEARLASIADAMLSDVALYASDGSLVAAAGAPIALREIERARAGRTRGKGAYLFHLALPDGRELFARHRFEHGIAKEFGGGALLLAAAVAVGAFPLARRLTRRLERLRARVDALGAGDLAARVEVEGRDEVAALARSFNRAAAHIERLVDAQRSMFAGASHELRSPLTRIRMALELHAQEPRPALREQIERDVAEIDELIGELLMASRLEAAVPPDPTEEVDLLALVAEEAARTGAAVSGEPVVVPTGDTRMLRRMVRNLLENARRHGGGAEVEASVAAGDAASGARAVLRVDDRGPGVPESERERIFDPFYRREGARSEGAGGGVGLGLALVRRIARHHGGDARCIARPGGGTRFEVEL
jgi:signal transduction histidine kinase